jgi:UDP-N-acetylmuramate dehydrogenase
VLTKDLELEITLPAHFFKKEEMKKEDIKKVFPHIKFNVSLAEYTTFKIGGIADYFLEVENKEKLKESVLWARDNNLPFFIFSGGSNVLFSDKGYRGLVIKTGKGKINFKEEKIISFSGNLLRDIISFSLKEGLTGLEWSCGIPGSIGGAVFGNAGAFDSSIKDSVLEVEALDLETKKIKKFKNKECLFGYRESLFKKNNYVILEVLLKLKKEKKEIIEENINSFLKKRKEKQPLGNFSAGSVFKNEKGVSAGFLIEKCGLKGKRIGNAVISQKHANFILNLGKAKAKEVKELIEIAKKEVKKKFGIDLKEEIILIGDF